MSGKKSLIILALACLVCFSCCSKKTEGVSVTDMSEEDIVKNNSFSKIGSVSRSVNNKTSLAVRRFSGIEELVVLQPKGDCFEITLSSEVGDGELRLFICDSESIVYEFQVNEKDQKYTLPSTNKKYFLKAAGSNAKYRLEFSYEKIESSLPSFQGTIL